jgi:hypothetical protein
MQKGAKTPASSIEKRRRTLAVRSIEKGLAGANVSVLEESIRATEAELGRLRKLHDLVVCAQRIVSRTDTTDPVEPIEPPAPRQSLKLVSQPNETMSLPERLRTYLLTMGPTRAITVAKDMDLPVDAIEEVLSNDDQTFGCKLGSGGRKFWYAKGA